MRANKGMTLLEVMLALIIFASASLSVQFAVGQHLASLNHIENKMLASLVADNQLARIKIAEAVPTSTQRGQSEMGDITWYWKIESVRTAEGLLRALDINVYSDAERKHSVYYLRMYMGG
uniref:type II secretion system minor pseudopilin GspI n=1 Tax=Thaumasiovibrio occultus TaxID=1891184 RepID=UPI000B35EE44|nr:type II secretion system minor pseudopilin GspI [Thaumasiovibrio occultus]